MKKILMLAVFIFGLIGIISASAAGVVIDSARVNFTDETGYPFVDSGRTLVPLRATMEAVGADVSWDSETATATVSMGQVTLKCTAWEKKIYRNGVKIDNDAAACIVAGRTYLPIRAVLEAFGAHVGWNGQDVTVETDYGTFVKNMESGGRKDVTVWSKWSAAVASQDSGDFGGAAAKYMALAPNFVAEGDFNSSAMLYLRLGTCLTKTGDFKNASFAFRRESYYWEKAGKREETIDSLRRSNLIKSGIKIYAKTNEEDALKMAAFSKENTGVLLGAYAELERAVYNPANPSTFYMDTFPNLVGKDHGGYLLYLPYGTGIDHYKSHIDRARELGKTVQIALEPHGGLASVSAGDYLIRLASEMESSGVNFVLRFAGEMNDTTCEWYTPDCELYKEKFRIVADTFHNYAPHVPVVWSPNFYPADTMEDYYPGDAYVDYVGLSAYMVQQTVTDPLGEGVDRSVYSDILDKLVRDYGDRKPIIVSEGAPSYMDHDTMADITPFAVRQLREFYTYLPIRYPQVKMVFYFDADRERWRFSLSGNSEMLDTYKEVIQSPDYVSALYKGAFSAYIETADNVALAPGVTQFAAHVSYPYPERIRYVVYSINGTDVGAAYAIPFGVSVDLSPYSGQRVTIKVKAFGDSGLLTEETQSILVK